MILYSFRFTATALVLLSLAPGAYAAKSKSAAVAKASTGTTGTTKSAGITDIISGALGGLGGNTGFGGFNGTFPGAIGVPTMTNLTAGCQAVSPVSCSDAIPDSAADAGGQSCPVDNGTISNEIGQARQVVGNLTCKVAALDQMGAEVTCLNQQAQALVTQLGSVGQVFSDNIHQMQTQVQKNQDLIADRTAQLVDTNGHLNGRSGDGQNGSPAGSQEPGLRSLVTSTQAMVSKMVADIVQVKKAHVDIDNAKQRLTEAVQTETMALTNKCFTQDTNSTFQCFKNGPPVTAAAYVACRYAQNQNVSSNGVVEQNAIIQQSADGRAQQLQGLLGQIFAQTPSDTKITIPTGTPTDGSAPSSADQAQQSTGVTAFESQARAILTPDQIATQYKAALQAYDGAGLSISSFVLGYIQKCYNDQSKVVDQERQQVGSTLGQMQARITDQQTGVQAVVNKNIDDYAGQTGDVMAGLTGQNLPLNTAACLNPNQTPKGQEKCMQDAYTNLKGLLEGSTPQSTVNVTIKGTDPTNTIPIQCQGLKGCVRKLENLATNLTTEVGRVKQFEKDYVVRSNQAIENYARSIAGQLNPQNAALNGQIQGLNGALAHLGVKELIKNTPVKGEPFAPDDKFDGLYKIPVSSIDVIGGMMAPPLVDVTGDIFTAALTGIASRTQELGKNEAEANKVIAQLSGLPGKCAAEAAKEKEKQQQQNQLGDIISSIMGMANQTGQKTDPSNQDQASSAASKARRDPTSTDDPTAGYE